MYASTGPFDNKVTNSYAGDRLLDGCNKVMKCLPLGIWKQFIKGWPWWLKPARPILQYGNYICCPADRQVLIQQNFVTLTLKLLLLATPCTFHRSLFQNDDCKNLPRSSHDWYSKLVFRNVKVTEAFDCSHCTKAKSEFVGSIVFLNLLWKGSQEINYFHSWETIFVHCRLLRVCTKFVDEIGEDELYAGYRRKPESRREFENFLCRGTGVFGDCKDKKRTNMRVLDLWLFLRLLVPCIHEHVLNVLLLLMSPFYFVGVASLRVLHYKTRVL